MSEAMDNYLDDLRRRRKANEIARQEAQENADPGWLATMFANLAIGYGNVGASLLKGAGAQINALDERGRESSYVDSIRNGTSSTLLGDIGKWMVDTGSEWQRGSQNVQSSFGTRKKYADLGLVDRVTEPGYWTDPRGAWADAMQGVGSSAPFLALSAIAPEVSIGSRAFGALSGAPGLLGKGFGALAERGAGAAIDKMIPIGALTSPLDAFTNASEIYDDLKTQGLSDTEIAARIREAAAEELPYDFLNSAIFGGVVSGRLGRALAGGARANLGRRIAGGLGTIPIEMGSEYAQESMQQRMTNKYTGKPTGTWYDPSPEEAAAGAAGAIGALLPALGGAAHTAYTGGDEEATNPFIGSTKQGGRANRGNASETPSVTSTSDLSADEIATILGGGQNIPNTQGAGAPRTRETSAPQNPSGGQRTSAPSYQDTAYETLDEVSDTNLDSLTERKLNALAHDYEAKFGEKLQVTSMRRHGDGSSWHDSGQAFDLAGGLLETSQEARDWLMQQGEKYGLYGLDEYNNPSEHATGGHIHFSDHGEDAGVPETNEPVQESDSADISGRQGGRVAQLISERTGIPADWIWAQMMHETGGFDSVLAREHHNYGGIKATNGAKEVEGGSPEGGNYRHFDSDEEYADYAARNLLAYAEDGVLDARNMEEFVSALHRGGYFTDNDNEGNPISPEEAEANYVNGMKSALEGNGTVRSGGSSQNLPMAQVNAPVPQQQQDQTNLIQMLQSLADNTLPRDTRKAILDMAEEKKETFQGLAPEQEAEYTNFMQQAIQNGDLLAILKAHPQETFQILMGGKQNASQPKAAPPTPKIETKRNFLSSLGIDAGRLKAERDNIRDMHFKQLAGDEASSGKVPRLDRAINTDAAKAAGNMAMAGFMGSKGWERGQLGAALEQALQNPATAQQAADAIRQMQAEDEAAYFAGDVHVKEGVGKNQRPIQIRSKDNGLTPEAQQKYNSPDWQNFADREGYKSSGETAPHVANVKNTPKNTQTKESAPLLSGNDRLLRDAFAPVSDDLGARKQQAKAIRMLAKQQGVTFSKGVAPSLNLGAAKAIAKAQQDLLDAGVSIPEHLGIGASDNAAPIRQAQNVASEATNEGGEKSAQNPTLQDRVNDLRGNPKGTKVESVKASEIASIINSAGERSAQNQDSSSNRNSIASNERESYQAAYDRMQKAREDYRSGKLPAAKAREEINAAYGQYVRGTFVMDARHRHNLRDMVDGFEREETERATSGKREPARKEDTDGHMEWIRQNPFVYDNSKSVDENLARAEKMAQEYMDKYGETYHINTSERQEIRRDIIKNLYGDGAKNKNSEAFLIIGLPASGKSSIAKPIIKANGALQIDSDDVKEQLPEFSNGLLAKAVHEESSNVAEDLLKFAMSNGDNIVLPLVGRTESNLQEKIGKLKESGYKVHLIYLELPMEETIRRGKNRFKEEGRLVPIDYIRSVGLQPKQNYDKIKTKKGVDDYAAWSNDVPRGSEPRLLESSSGTDPLRWLGRGLDTQSLDAVRTGSNRVSQEERPDTQRTDNEITQPKHSESQGASSIGEESAQKQEGKKEDSIFGSIEDADREMFEALGITPEDAENEELSFTNEFGDTTDEEIEALKKELSKELNKLSANPVFNPRVYSLGLQLGGKYIQKGYRTFKKWLDKMRGDLGENIEPWAPAIWETLKTYPKGQKFDSKQVMAVSRAIGARYERGMTALDDIQKDFTKNMSASNKKTFAPLIEASYNGIRKFFDEREAARNGEETRRNVETGQGESQGASGGYRDVESGEVSGADEERGRGGTERTAATPGSEPQSRARDEAGDTRTDGRSGDAGGSGRKRVGSKDDRSGNGAGSNQQSVLKEDPSKDGDKPAEVPGHNFHITKASGIGEGGEKTKFKQNIEAIKLLKKLEAEGRRATPEEQAILAKFNGWGTVKSAFSNSKDWEKEYAQLKELLTPEEYKEAASASLNAFYTSPEVVNAIWKGVERLGFKGGRVLDPSMGTGNFFGMMPLDMANASSLHGVEKDSLTGRLAKQLYQKADVQVAGFEETSLPNNFFDLAISNVPFGETTPFDRAYEKTSTGENVRYRIHNYFFAKAMDKVRPGGLVAFITGPGTMQTTSKEANLLRLEMGRKADLVAAFKLPGNAFEKNAGTSVTTDVLILQKRVNPRQPAKYAQKWDEVGTINIKDPQRSGIYDYGTNFNINEYYQKHPDNMIGKPVADKLYGQRDRMGLDGKGLDVGKELSKRMGKLPKDIYAPAKVKQHSTPESTKKFLSDPGTLERSYVMKDGKPYQNIGGELNEVPSKSAKAVVAYCKLRSALNAVLKAQIDPAASDTVIEKLRKELNQAYDSFVKDHGYVNAKKNVSALGDDPMYGQVAAVEKYEYDKDAKTEKASKTDIFTKRTVGAIREISSADSPTDALTASIAQMGKVDIPYMANLLGKSENETIQALGDLVYENPSTGQQELAEEYLSGNVRAKLAEAETAAKTNPAYKRNVEALKKVQPVDYTEHDIKANIGAPWIPAEVYQGFTKHMVGVPLEIKHEKLTNTWKVGTNWGADHTKMFNTWGTSSLPFNELLERILGMKEIQVKEKNKDGNTIVNTEATAAAVAKAEEVQAEFEKWLWSEEGRKTELLKSYNKLFNSEVERNYDGSALTFPGLVSHIRKKLYPHQKNAIWRMMQGGNTLIAHCVGAGKTWEMQIAGMEMKRVGICRKPMYVVPNNIVEQFRKEFYETYPNAKLLVLTAKDLPGAKLGGADTFTEKLDTTKHKETKGGKAQKKEKEEAGKRQERLNKRRAALSRIATEDWDGIIISHNLFTNLPMSPESYNEFYREQLDELDAAIRQMKSDEFGKMDKRSVTALENAKENLENRLKRDVSEDKKEVVIPFEELGIDQIFVDEADKFKNLAFHTSMGRLSGISTSNAKRSTDMYVKTRYMTKTYGRGIVFATGTPISNSMNEMYTMQRYLDADKLKDLGMNHFDSWAAMFGRKKDESEPSPDGNGFRMVTKLKFTNLQVLGKIYRSFADIKLPEDLPYLKRPKLKNGSRTVISVESTDAFDELKQTLVERTDAIRSGHPMTRTKKDGSTYEDNMLAVTNDFRTASLDMRLIDPTLSAEEAGAKVAALCDTVKRKYDETTPVSGAQVIFADIGTPKPQKDTGATDDESVMVEETAENITVYDEIKKELIQRGIPANEIGFVHDGKNPTQRQALFEKVNEGKLRVFIGSTETMGAGTNFQHHLAALHHLDCPWKPRDVEQREGRILRAGNENPEVEIFTYVTKGSYDANMWDKVRYKQQMIDSVMRGDPAAEEMDDISSNSSAEYGDIEAIAMDNPLMAEKVNLDAEVMRLKSLESSYNKEQRRMRGELQKLPAQIEQAKADAGRASADIKDRVSTKGDDFRMKLGDKVYTKRADATKALEAIEKSFRKPVSTKIGEIGGFEIHMRFDQAYVENIGGGQVVHGRNVIQLVNHGSYTAEPSVSSMEYALSHAPEKALHGAETLLQKSEERRKGLNEEIGKPFKQKEQLDAAVKRQQEIQKQLDEANKPKEVQGNESTEKTEAQESIQAERDQNQDTESRPGEEASGREVGIDIIGKFSASGEIRKILAGIQIVNNEELNSQQRKFSELGEAMGVPVVWIDADSRLNGFHQKGVTFLNRKAGMSLQKTFWHEQFHWLRNNNDDLWRELLTYFKGKDAFSKKQIEAYQKKTGRYDLTSDEAVIEEMLADAFMDVSRRVPIMKELARDDRSLAQKLVAWIKDMMNRFVEMFHNPEGRLTTEQRDIFVEAFGKLARDMVDADGKKIFKTYDDGKTIRLADGAELAPIRLSSQNGNDPLLSMGRASRVSDKEYMATVKEYQTNTGERKSAAWRSLQKMVADAANEAGFDNAIPEQTVAYKVRTGAAPKKTIKVYKVFTVANDGSPTALFIGGTEKLPQGVWLDAQDAWHFTAENGHDYVPSTQNPYTKGGKTGAMIDIPNEEIRQELIKRGFIPAGSKAAKVTALAYRPGWHAGTLPFFPQGGVKPKAGQKSAYANIHRYNQVVFECELAAEKDYTQEAESQPKAKTKTGKLNTRAADLQYMPENGFYYYATNPMTHGHPELGMWAISGSLKINRALTQEECDDILRDHGMEPQEWEQGKLDLTLLGYTGEQHDAAKKTLAPITYDDSGKVIPLSKRFNKNIDDVRFSIDNSEKMGDNEVTRQYRDIPTRAQEFVSNELNNPGLAHRVTSSDDIDSVCDKVVAPLKEMAEVILDRHQRTNDPLKKERMLNQAAFFVGMVDEIRRDFNAGGRIYEIVSRSGLVRGQAREGSNLAESLRYRGREIAEASRTGKEIGVKIAGAVDGFSGRHQSIVDDIRKQDRGDGVKFSVNMNSETTEGRSESQDASSIGENERGWFDRIYERFGKSAGIKAGKIIVEERAKGSNDIGFMDYVAGSPSRIAEKVKMFRQFFVMGDRAMNTLTKNRSDFARKLEQAMNLVKNKEDREDLFNVLLIGDAEGKEYTKQQLMEEEGVNGNVADAYIRIRRLMTKAYHMVNDAKRRPQMHSRRMTDKEIMDLKDNKFVEIKSVHEVENGKKLVSYKEYANWEKSYTVDAETLARFEQDDAMQVLGYEQNEDGSYTVDVREAVPPVNKLTGYIPHFFHDYMIRVKDADGNYVATIGSGRTENDAIKKAEAWLKKNELEDGQQVYIAPKAFSFDSLGMDEGQYAAVMGDTDFDRMMNSIAEKNDMTLAEAKEMMKGSVKKKNRHRFFGNLMHRQGVKGYEQDLNWVLRHYFNSASRYAAMETEFKPKAISLFERYFGDFNKDHTGLAKYTKDYINDINGNPTALEDAINKSLNKSELWRKLAVSNFGDRAALQLANTVTNWTSMLCLGYLNASSAILNFTQAINATAYLGSMAAGGDIFKYGFRRKYGQRDMRVLVETNVMNDIGLDSGSGYDTNRGYAGKALGALGWVSNKGMVLFKLSEGAMRRGTVLAAYHKAIDEGKSHAEAIAYAKEINRKSNFDYGVADAPNIFRRGSIISQLALQFKKYAFKELEVMGDFLPMLSKDTNRKQKLLFWGMYFLACGLLQVPAIDWLDKLLGENMKDFVQKSIMEAAGDSAAGKLLAKTAMYGLPAIGGIDISNRAGMADVVPSKPTDIFGPSLNKTASLISDLAKGDGAAAIRDVSPGIYNQYTAWIAGESTGSRGRINNRYDSFYDKALKSIGFKSTDERIASDIQRITYNERSRLTKEKQAAVDEYLANPTTENAMKLRELGVKPDTVKKERERKKADRLGRVQAGMSKEERERYGDLMKFAE